MNWQSIETAPKDGTGVCEKCSGEQWITRYVASTQLTGMINIIFMPIPPRPCNCIKTAEPPQ